MFIYYIKQFFNLNSIASNISFTSFTFNANTTIKYVLIPNITDIKQLNAINFLDSKANLLP